MKVRGFSFTLMLILLLTACQSEDPPIPTLIQISTFTPSAEPNVAEVEWVTPEEVAILPTQTIPTEIPQILPSETPILIPTATPTLTETVAEVAQAVELPSETPTLQILPSEVIPTDTPTLEIIPTETEIAAIIPTDTPTLEIIPTETPSAAIIPTDSPTVEITPTETPTTEIALVATIPASVTFTFTPSPTETSAISPTPSKTLAPTQPEEVIEVSEALTALVTAQALNIRNGPADDFDIIAHLETGAIVPIIGVSDNGQWYLVEYVPDSQGWLFSGFVEVNGSIEVAPNAQPTALPEFVRLDGITWIQQQFNNCAPTSVTITLTYYGGGTDQNIARDWMRPTHNRDVSVDIQQMVDYVNETQPGLRAVWRMGGNWTVIRRLLAAGYPVIIETSVEVHNPSPGWAGHNRTLIGYDGDVILSYDSFLGHGNFQGYRIPQNELDEVWRHMNRHFMVVYPIEKEAEVAYLMGEMWSVPRSIERAHEIALAEMAANPDSVFAMFNLGATYSAQGNYEAAAAAFDTAFEASRNGPEQIPFRIFWYQFDVFKAYYYTGRYSEVIDHARRALLNMGGNGAEELYYWLGMGYAGRGQLEKAKVQLENSITFNSHFIEAQEALEQINAGTYSPPL